MMHFRLKELLERPGAPSQAALARSVGVPRQQINRLVNGNIERIDLKTLTRLYRALGCRSVDELIQYVPEPAERQVALRTQPSATRAWVTEQLIGLLLANIHRDPGQVYTDPAVREAAEAYFEQHRAQDVARGGMLSGLHARLMQEMVDFLKQHGASLGEEAESIESGEEEDASTGDSGALVSQLEQN
jgi:DNA-binding Xre family transcriptional regulator